MRKTIKLAVVAALALGATSAFATNGDNLIATGAKARGMGGVGIAKEFGSQSSIANPALLSSVEKMEVSGSVTMFMPDVESGSNAGSSATHDTFNPTGQTAPLVTQSSDADQSFIPEISFAQRINDQVVYGVSITGTAGMGVDYDDAAFGTAADNGVFRMKTALELLKVAVPVSYETNGASIGIAAVMQYGTLQMSHMASDGAGSYDLLDNGASSDTAFGYEIGAAYDLGKVGVEGLTLGAVYKSKLAMTYDNTIGASIEAFQLTNAITSGDKLDQPAEMGVGVSYAMGENTVSLDYKNVAWGDAAGYSDFGWEDQDIIAVGYEYATKTWALRVGYNHSNSPIKEQDQPAVVDAATGGAAYVASAKNFFNLAGFPGIVESHFTIGGSFGVSDALALDVSAVYAPEVSDSFNTTGMTAAFSAASTAGYLGQTSSIDTTHSQFGLSIGATYKF